MGAINFSVVSSGSTAKEAFQKAVNTAKQKYGAGGYTGSIAEKDTFVMIHCPLGDDPSDYARKLLNSMDPRIDDVWGDAGCIDLGGGEYLFFGVASM